MRTSSVTVLSVVDLNSLWFVHILLIYFTAFYTFYSYFQPLNSVLGLETFPLNCRILNLKKKKKRLLSSELTSLTRWCQEIVSQTLTLCVPSSRLSPLGLHQASLTGRGTLILFIPGPTSCSDPVGSHSVTSWTQKNSKWSSILGNFKIH